MSILSQRIFFENLFARKFVGNKPHITCFYYGQRGHDINTCAHRKGTDVPIIGDKVVWMPKAFTSKFVTPSGP